MLKSFNELKKVDVSKYIEKRKDEKGNEFDYMPWTAVLELLYENGADKVRWGVYHNEKTGHSLHMTEQAFLDKNGVSNHCPEVHVWVEIDGERVDYDYPVISGSFVVRDLTLNQQRIHTAIVRAQCKAVAINWGLGFNLWKKDDLDMKSEMDIISMQSAKDLYTKLGMQVTELMQNHGLTEAEIADRMGLDTDRVGDVIRVEINHIRKYEKALDEIKKEVTRG